MTKVESPDGDLVEIHAPDSGLFTRIKFQSGPVKQFGENGCQIEDLLKICRTRLMGLNLRMDSHYNREALNNISKALEALDRRTADREARGVEGTERP